METRAHQILIGTFSLLVVLAAVLFVLWLGKVQVDRKYHEFDVVFTEPVSGLRVGGTVAYNGIKVGEVTDLRIDADDPSRVRAHIKVDMLTPVKVDTRANLAFQGVTGVSFIQLSGGSASSPPLQAKPGQPRAEILAQVSGLQKLFASGSDAITSVNALLARVGVLLSDANLARVEQILSNLETTSNAVAKRAPDLDALIADSARAMHDIRTLVPALKQAAQTLAQLSESGRDMLQGNGAATLAQLRAASAQFARAADELSGILAENRAPLREFSVHGLRDLSVAVEDLRTLLKTLNRISLNLEHDPAGYLLQGKTEEVYQDHE